MKANGVEIVAHDPGVDYSYELINGLYLIGAACDAFFLRRGLPVAEFGDKFRSAIGHDVRRANAGRTRKLRTA